MTCSDLAHENICVHINIHVDASQQIATFGDCTFDRDDAGGSCGRISYKQQVRIYSTNLIYCDM